jgi:trehalose 6-phosphate phosphatase
LIAMTNRKASVRLETPDLSQVAILLDVDGTILDIAPTPHEVYVPGALRQALTRVHELAGGALALVSGRTIANLDFIFDPLLLPVIGGHGAEMRPDPTGDTYEQKAPSLDRELKKRLLEVGARYPGVATEDKGYSLALHYRLALDRGLEVVDDVFRICKAYPPDSFELLTGKAVLEVKTTGFNKGTAVRELMTYPPFAGRRPIFIGDDTTDEAAFEVMPEFDGLAVSVGRKVPGTDGRFQSPSDVRHWLERMAAETSVAPSLAVS